MIAVLLILHLIVVFLFGAGIYLKKIKTKALIFPVVLFVPVCGILMFAVESVKASKAKAGRKEISVGNLKIEEVKFKRIEMENVEDSSMVVPLEEAILINDAKTRRKLMLDILHRNPEEHIALLQRARLAEDTELTHYATTTMMEIQGVYEENIRKLEAGNRSNPGNIKTLRMLRKELTRYCKSGLLTGNVQRIYLKKLGMVLSELHAAEPENKKYFLEKIENEIDQSQDVDVEKELREAQRKWPEDEHIYQLMVRYYQNIRRGDLIQKVLDEITDKNIYLSSDGKKWYGFWRNKEQLS